jgi:hypothetical protein
MVLRRIGGHLCWLPRRASRETEILRSCTSHAAGISMEADAARQRCVLPSLHAISCVHVGCVLNHAAVSARLRDVLAHLLLVSGGCIAVRGGAETHLWKLCFHTPIQVYRAQLKQASALWAVMLARRACSPNVHPFVCYPWWFALSDGELGRSGRCAGHDSLPVRRGAVFRHAACPPAGSFR